MMKRAPLFLFALLTVGALALAAGVTLARSWLPEWQSGVAEKAFYVGRFQELVRRSGVKLEPGAPQASLTGPRDDADDRRPLDEKNPDLVSELGASLRVRVSQLGRLPGDSESRRLTFEFSPRGKPLALTWTLETRMDSRKPVPRARTEALARLLLEPGERLGPHRPQDEDSFPIVGSNPPQTIEIVTSSNREVAIQRKVATAEASDDDTLLLVLLLAVPLVLGILTTLWMFLRLLYRQRIDFANALSLAALSIVPVALSAVTGDGWREILGPIVNAFFLALWIVAAWATAESLLRAAAPGFTTSLDLLRSGRLGPRGGKALLAGIGLGAALGGLRLAALAAAGKLPGTWLQGLSLRFPLLQPTSPLSDGILLAAGVLLATGLALRYLPERWAPWVAAGVAGLCTSPIVIGVRPIGWALGLQGVQAAFLVWVLRRFGLTTLLSAAVFTFLLPAAAFAATHASWLPLELLVTAGATSALVALGSIGLNRPEQIEIEGRRAPAFIRRIEEQNRIKHEMDLLARMQVGLLPDRIPELPGWQIAVQSLLATEAGGDLYDFLTDEDGQLWIAAGDVAGHGYSCSIAQAMTAASLASLVHARQTPAGVLQKVDRVLRRNAAHRLFTSLALLRLDPETGQGRLANGGHPFPLLLADGEATEIALTGLPLGQGPPREYREIQVEIPPGGVLIFCSDGLFEGTDWQGVPYGYDRPRELLAKLNRRIPARDVVDALFADWRRHLGTQEHSDDTTVLVIKRL